MLNKEKYDMVIGKVDTNKKEVYTLIGRVHFILEHPLFFNIQF